MKFIKFEFGDGTYELIKLKSIEGIQIRENTITILVASGKTTIIQEALKCKII